MNWFIFFLQSTYQFIICIWGSIRSYFLLFIVTSLCIRFYILWNRNTFLWKKRSFV